MTQDAPRLHEVGGLSIRVGLAIGASLMLLLFGGGAFFLGHSVARLQGDLSALHVAHLAFAELSGLQRNLRQRRADVLHALAERRTPEAEVLALREAREEAVARVLGLAATLELDPASLEELARSNSETEQALTSALALDPLRDPAPLMLVLADRHGFHSELDDRLDRADRQLAERLVAAERRLRAVRGGLLLVPPLALLLAALAASLFVLPIHRGMSEIRRVIERLASADFGARATLTGPSEARVIQSALNWLSDRLVDSQARAMVAEKAALTTRIAAGLAHELNTPLQFVRSSVEVVHEAHGALVTERAGGASVDGELLAEVPGAFESIDQGLTRIGAVVATIQTISRGSDQAAPLADLAVCVRGAVELHRHELEPVARVEVRLEAVPLVSCSNAEATQLVSELILNARDAIRSSRAGGGARGAIRIDLHAEGSMAVLSVEDDGGGVPAEIAARIFDPFFTTKEVGAGVGQGLAQAAAIARRYRGSLTLDRAFVGGARFVLRLGVDAPGAGAASEGGGAV